MEGWSWVFRPLRSRLSGPTINAKVEFWDSKIGGLLRGRNGMFERIRHLMVGARDEGESPPSWDGPSARLKVLVESDDPAVRREISEELEAGGFDVASCGGPFAQHSGDCVLVRGGFCPAAADADVICHRLNPGNPACREVLVSLRRRYPRTPIVVEVPEPDLKRFADVLDGCSVVLRPADAATMVAAIRGAVTRAILADHLART